MCCRRVCETRSGGRCGLDAEKVDVLVNAGLYHDRNLGEPALAPLIQDDLGANRDDPHAGAVGVVLLRRGQRRMRCAHGPGDC
jgi:hypothetical protein